MRVHTCTTCVCVHVCVVHAFVVVWVHARECRVCVCLHACLCLSLSVCACAHVRARVCVRACVCVCEESTVAGGRQVRGRLRQMNKGRRRGGGRSAWKHLIGSGGFKHTSSLKGRSQRKPFPRGTGRFHLSRGRTAGWKHSGGSPSPSQAL